jgi:hypothetical protein
MGKPYDTPEEALAKRRNGETTRIDPKTKKYHNVRDSKTKKSGKMTWKEITIL